MSDETRVEEYTIDERPLVRNGDSFRVVTPERGDPHIEIVRRNPFPEDSPDERKGARVQVIEYDRFLCDLGPLLNVQREPVAENYSADYYHPGDNPAVKVPCVCEDCRKVGANVCACAEDVAPEQGDGSFDTGDIRPSYYKAHGLHEVKNCLKAWGVKGKAYIWTAIVYLARLDEKGTELDALDDLCKARFWIDEEIRDRKQAMSERNSQ